MPKTNRRRFLRLYPIRKRISGALSKARTNSYPRIKNFVRSRPMTSFFITLGILFLAILLNSLLTPSPETIEEAVSPKQVSIYKIGVAPKVSFTGIVEKEGVVQIVAQAPGIVNSVNVVPGQSVWRGTVLVNLASNYVGGNALGVQARLASIQHKNVKETFDTQKEIIAKQREITNKTNDNAGEIRDITNKSIDETKSVISLNDSIISTLEGNLATLEATNTGGVNDAAILSTKQLLSQAKSGNNQLNQALRNAELQSSGDKPPAELSRLQKDLALKQLEIQEKALDLSREASKLQLVLAQIAASAMSPASPFEGVVERVHVSPGEFVNVGTPLATVASSDKKASVIVKVPKRIVDNISKIEPASLFINGKTYEVIPEYISSEATDSLLYSVIYSLPEEFVGKITDRDFIQVDIPIGYPDAISAIPYLPIDIIFQTQDSALVYVVEEGKAKSRKILLGDVIGGTVAVEEGLEASDRVILDRNIIEGEEIQIVN